MIDESARLNSTMQSTGTVNTVSEADVHLALPRIRTRIVQHNPVNIVDRIDYVPAGPIEYDAPSSAVARGISGFDSDNDDAVVPATVRYNSPPV